MIKIISIDKNPISLIGKNAAVCYGKPIEDGYSESDYKRGLACIESGHGRALEYASVDVEVSGYSARCIREVYTHIVGTTRLQESTRYIDMSDFGYFMPDSIRNNPRAHMLYVNLMVTVKATYEQLRAIDIPIEDCANTLPIAYNSRITFKINVRSLLHLAEERMCRRAYHEIRDFVNEFKKALWRYGIDEDSEWCEIVQMMRPKCRKLGYCPEKKGCGMMISKEEAMRVLREYQGIMDLFEPSETTKDENKPDILKKEFNLPKDIESRTCAVCGKTFAIRSDAPKGVTICKGCFENGRGETTDSDDGVASKMDRV